VADSPPHDGPLYRGTFIQGGKVDEVLASLTGDLDMPLLSTGDSQDLARSFAGTRDVFGTEEPGVVVYFTFPPGTRALEGLSLDPGSIDKDVGEVDEAYEWVVGGRFHVDSAVIDPADPNRINVALRQVGVHTPFEEAE
jgi:hypothetical protein